MKRKPHPFGNKYYITACCNSKRIFWIEINEGPKILFYHNLNIKLPVRHASSNILCLVRHFMIFSGIAGKFFFLNVIQKPIYSKAKLVISITYIAIETSTYVYNLQSS